MILLYTTDLFLIESKYSQLVTLVKHFKPDYVVLNGSLLSPHPYYKYNTDTINKIQSIIKYIADSTKVICQLGNFDTKGMNGFINSLCQQNSNIINLTAQNYYYGQINFLGVSGVVTDRYNNEWIISDDKNHNDSFENKLNTLSENIDMENTIIVTSIPPIGILDVSDDPMNHGSYTLRNFLYNESESPRILLTAGFPDNFKYTKQYYNVVNECVCVNPSQPLDDFYYCILNIDNNLNVIDIWHPKKFYSEELRNG